MRHFQQAERTNSDTRRQGEWATGPGQWSRNRDVSFADPSGAVPLPGGHDDQPSFADILLAFPGGMETIERDTTPLRAVDL